MSHKQSIIFFDGVCNLCNASIDFVIQRDKDNKYLVGALQDEVSKKILSQFSVDKNYLDSIVLLEANQIFYKSTAALKIAKNLSGLWPLLYPLIFLPVGFRDYFYNWIGKNRYKWYGKKSTCRLPTKEEQDKFLTQEKLPDYLSVGL